MQTVLERDSVQDRRGVAREVSLSAALVGILGAGLLLRVWYALTIAPFVDEYASVYAARAITERGIPLLPSGLLYLHGAPFSYLAAPFVVLGGDSEFMWRVPSVLVGTATLFAIYHVGSRVFSRPVGLIAAIILAFAPEAVQWSGRARMYALLQLLALVSMFALYKATESGGRKYAFLFSACFVAAVFTQMEALILLPALLLAVVICGKGRWLLTSTGLISMALCGAGSVLFLGLQQLGSPPLWESAGSTLPLLGRLSEYLSVPSVVQGAFYQEYFLDYPRVILTVLFAGTPFLLFLRQAREFSPSGSFPWTGLRLHGEQAARGMFFFVAYTLTVLEFALLVQWHASEHYVFFVAPLFILIGSNTLWSGIGAILALLPTVPGFRPLQKRVERRWSVDSGLRGSVLLVATLAGSAVVLAVGGAWNVPQRFSPEPDYSAAFRYVQGRMVPGDVVMTASPVSGSLYLDTQILFMLERGYEGYVVEKDGQPVYNLTGSPWIGSVAEARRILATRERVWFVVDDDRLSGRYSEDFIATVNRTMSLAFNPQGVRVYLRDNTPLQLDPEWESALSESAALEYIAERRGDVVSFYTAYGWDTEDSSGMIRDWLGMTDEPLIVDNNRDPKLVAIGLGWRP
ncbi:MAG: ArnT family glycosyltransferase [Chloroflexota bacterium]